MSKLIEVTILVPESDINIIDSSVTYEKGDRDNASGYDVSVWEIEVKGMDYKIEIFDDLALEDKAIEEWRNK